MNKKIVQYKKSQKKQIIYAVIWFLIIMVFGFNQGPLNTPYKLIVFGVVAVILTIFVLVAVRKAAREATCPHCGVDLFESIGGAKNAKIQFNYCPSCGNEVQI